MPSEQVSPGATHGFVSIAVSSRAGDSHDPAAVIVSIAHGYWGTRAFLAHAAVMVSAPAIAAVVIARAWAGPCGATLM
jgi:hypothetical protein